MIHPLRITDAAARDLEEIFTWIADHDSNEKAGYVLDRILQFAESNAAMPHKGSRPIELPAGLEGEFRQVFFKPYRVTYEFIADGRRNLQSLLIRRLIRG